MSRRRVLLLIKTLSFGGAERLLVSSASHMDHDAFEYRVAFLTQASSDYADALRGAGLHVERIRSPIMAGWLPRLSRILRDRRLDLVHAHSPLPAVGARLLRDRRTPVVYTEHSVWPNYHRLTRLANRLTYGRNAHVFAVSDGVRDSILARRPASAPVVETLHYGVDLDDAEAWSHERLDLATEFGIPEGAPVVASVGNLRPVKGQRDLLEAAVEVRAAVPDVRFLLIGDGPMRSELESQAERLGLAQSVIFTGFRGDAPRLVASADVFALPSLYDGLSIALIEAMALGRGIALTAAGGNVEAVDHEREALIVPPGRADALAAAIVRLLTDEELCNRLGEAARRRAQAFDIGRAVRRQEEVYRALLDGGGAAG